MHPTPIATAIAGIGGFGRSHQTSVHELEKSGTLKLIGTCDPALAALGEAMEAYDYAGRGVALYEDFDTLMAKHGDTLGLLTVAAPIRFHAPMHRACRERSIACYLEKPPTLDPQELEAMIALDEAARFSTQVGFNYIYQPYRHTLKERILKGEFGRLLRIGYQGLWQRQLAYYARNGWAGRLLLSNDYVVLDSCCGNAMSHHLHNILFFAGSEGLYSWARPKSMDAELYRANNIQGTDTIFARGVLENGVEFRLATTHACKQGGESREIITCEKAEIEIHSTGKWTLRHCDGSLEEHDSPKATLLDNLQLYSEYLRGERSRPETRLKDCRAFVQLNALLYVAAGRITPVGDAHKKTARFGNDTSETVHIPGIEEATEVAITTGAFPSEQGAAWSAPGGSAPVEALSRLRPVLQQLAEAK